MNFVHSLIQFACIATAACGTLLAQKSTNVVNSGTDVLGLPRIQNVNGTGGAEVILATNATPGTLIASQTPLFSDFPLSAVWYSEQFVPGATADAAFYSVSADFLPANNRPEWRGGVMGWLELSSTSTNVNKGIVLRLQPGDLPTAQLLVIDFNALAGTDNEVYDGLYQTNGEPASPFAGSAWLDLSTGYNPTNFTTLSLQFTAPTAADKAVVADATAHITGRVLQASEGQPATQIGDTLELITTLAVPQTNRFGYYASLGTTFIPGEDIGQLDNLVYVGTVGNRPPLVQITSPADGTVLGAPANVNVTASATDADGTVAKIEIFNNGVKVGEGATNPFTVAVTALPAGTNVFTARGTDNLGASSVSIPVTIVVQEELTQPRIASSALLPAPDNFQQFTITVNGLSGTYRVQASNDLINWVDVDSGPAFESTQTFTYQRQNGPVFYRVLLQ